MKNFIYEGFYYPVIGCPNTCFEGQKNRVAWSKKLGGYTGLFSWLPYIGIRCKVKNPNKPYKQFVIDKIEKHPEMVIDRWFFNEKDKSNGYMYIVRTKKNEYIGDIKTAYYISDLKDFKTFGKGNTVCVGYDKKRNMACGWSHRAKVCFGIGDRVFEENYGNDSTPFNKHGRKTIKSYADMMKSAMNFAKHVS